MKIVFRTNGGKNIGLGHIFRCLSLAKALKKINPSIDIIFIVNKEIVNLVEEKGFIPIKSNNFEDIELIKKVNPDITIFDSYLANNEYLNALRNIAKLVIFDDNNDIYDSNISDIIINGNLHAEILKYSEKTVKLLGPKYLVMKEEYWNINKQKINEDKSEIMITTGGADFNKLMVKFIKSLKNLEVKKNIIIGPSYESDYIEEIKKEIDSTYNMVYKPKSLKKYIENSDIIITAAGSTIYEILTLKRLPIIFTLANNQELIANKLEEYGIVNLGNFEQINFKNLSSMIENVINDKEYYYNRILSLFNLFDGKGALKVAKKIIDIVGG